MMSANLLDYRWIAKLTVPADLASVYADAMEPFADSLTIFESDGTGSTWQIQAVLAQGTDRTGLSAVVSLIASANAVAEPVLELAPLDNTDWLSKVRSDFPPFRVGRVFLHGSHYRPRPGDGPIRLTVDAGMAFGSGEHPTTRGCLLALQDLSRYRDAARILDMGCGSGILSLAAARLWRSRVIAIDIDVEAVRVTRANARLNGVRSHVTAGAGNGYAAPLMARQAGFDVIVSNILARPLRGMAPELARSLNPGGYAVLSGLLRWQAAAVIAAHSAQGLRLVNRYPVGDWQTLVMQR